MTQETTRETPPDTSKHARTLDLSVSQVLAGALAAVSSAVAASYFGVAGTLLGAAFGSIFGTVATAVYKHSLSRTGAKVREIVPIQTVVLRPMSDTTRRLRGDNGDSLPLVEGDPPAFEGMRFAGGTEAPGHPASTTGTTDSSPTDLPEGTTVAGETGPATPEAAVTPEDRLTPDGAVTSEGERRDWGRTAVLALAAFALALGGVTAVELLGGRPLSAWITGKDQRGTTVGEVTHPDPAPRQQPAPGPTGTPTTSPTARSSVSPSAIPSVSPSAGPASPGARSASPVPSGTPAPAPTGPASPSAAPSPGA